MKKKILALVMVVALAATAVVSGSMAYLQDEDSDVNVMTLGNVSIEQHEYQRVEENGAYKTDTIDNQTSYVLEDFVQGKALLPTTESTNHGAGPWDATTVRMSQVGSYGGMQVFTSKNAVDKFVTVENTGKSDAYVRTIVAIEVGDADADLIGISYHNTWKKNVIGTVAIDGVNYYVCEFAYQGGQLSDGSWRHQGGLLPAGDTSYPNLSQVYLKSVATNEDMEAIDGNGNGTLDILVLSQAVQTNGFADAQTALDTAFGKTADKAAEWFSGNIVSDGEDIKKIFNDNETKNTFELSKDVTAVNVPLYSNTTATAPVEINGNGNTVTGVASSVDAFQWSDNGTIPAMSNIFSSKDGAKVTVNDLTFTGTMSAVMAGNYVDTNSNWFNTEFNNVKIIDAEVVSFSSNISPALCVYGDMTMNNCEMIGTTLSELDTDPMWPVYDVAVVNYSNTVINNSKIGSLYMWNQAKVTVASGSAIDTIVIRGNMNTTKYGLVVEAGATVGSIDLSNITKTEKINITINDGANVGKFVDNGIVYDTIAAWQDAQ